MSWFSSIALRLYTGGLLGLVLSLAVGYLLGAGSARAELSAMVWVMMLVPMLLCLAAGFLVPEWLLSRRWRLRWLPMAQGEGLPVEGKRASAVYAALRELAGNWPFPPVARRRTARFVGDLARTLLRSRARQREAWIVYALAWYRLRADEEVVEELRDLFMESETLPDEAFDMGLSLLNERQEDLDLAVALARESLSRTLGSIAPGRMALLENAWLAAYARGEQLRRPLLPKLVQRFIDIRRRDEVSGRIYLDAVIAGLRNDEMRAEMLRTAEVLARTARSPEMTANLRALAGAAYPSQNEERELGEVAGTSLRAPKSWAEEHEKQQRGHDEDENVSDDPQEEPTSFMPVEELEQQRLAMLAMDEEDDHQQVKRSTPLRWFGLVALSLVLATAALLGYIKLQGDLSSDQQQREQSSQPKPMPLSPPGPMHSTSPFTVQVAALPTRDSAVETIQTLRGKGVDAYYVTTRRAGQSWFRIRFGEFNTTREAQQVADALLDAGYIQDYHVATFEPGLVPDVVELTP